MPALKHKYQVLAPYLDELALRVCVAADAEALGRGGVALVARASGLSRTTVYAGLRELRGGGGGAAAPPAGRRRVRRAGGGRKRLVARDPQLALDLDRLVDPVTRGDPTSPLRWTCKSTTRLAAELRRRGHAISPRSVWTLLDQLGYSMQSNRKTQEGAGHPDRDAQFQFIAAKVRAFQARGWPVISVDAKKKEPIGQFKNGGREWQLKGCPEAVNVHDFVNPAVGKVAPYGVYDVTRNEGWVSVGVTHDTAEFAVQTIRRWWQEMGQRVYPAATALLITADGGGSNGARLRRWKVMLQGLATELGLSIQVSHFPPGTSKWNKIEHRMFSHITANWRGRPLESRAVVVNLIASTRTSKGLTIGAALDETRYEVGLTVSAKELAALALVRDDFHGDWNYRIEPIRPQ